MRDSSRTLVRSWLKTIAFLAAVAVAEYALFIMLQDLYSMNPSPRAQALLSEIAKRPGSGDFLVMMALVGGLGIAFFALLVVAKTVQQTFTGRRD